MPLRSDFSMLVRITRLLDKYLLSVPVVLSDATLRRAIWGDLMDDGGLTRRELRVDRRRSSGRAASYRVTKC